MKNIQQITGFAGILFALSFMFTTPYAEAQSEFGGGSALCTPPTLGLNKASVSVVEDGFTINGQSYDVERFDQGIPVTSFKTGETNEIVLKIHEDSSSNNVMHVGLAIVTPQENNPKLTEIKSIIEWDKDHEGKETVKIIDSNNKLQDVSVDVVIDEEVGLAILSFSFEASEQLDPVALKVTTWDRKLCSWSNTFDFVVVASSESSQPVNTIIENKIASSTEYKDLEYIVEAFEPISPLNQVNLGISPNDVECKSEMILILNSNDGRPACVSDSGAEKLEGLGWGNRV